VLTVIYTFVALSIVDATEDSVRKLALVCPVLVLAFLVPNAYSQQMDFAFGMNTLTAPSASDASGDHFPQSLTGGAYPSFSGGVLITHGFGVNAEVTWRASRNLYAGVAPIRPVLFDVNAVYAPRYGRISPELMAGLGAENIRFYQNFISCGFSGCTNYTSSNHFLGHFGGGLRLYFTNSFFLRPEAHLYLVTNNNEFSSARATRFGVSIGYSFGGRY
jgi:hypothetical protein